MFRKNTSISGAQGSRGFGHDAPREAEDLSTFHHAPSFSFGHRLLRAAWGFIWFMFASWTPRPLHRWRVLLVNIFGGNIHSSCSIYPSVKIWYPPNLTMLAHSTLGPRVECYSMSRITLDQYAVVSQGVFLCTGSHYVNDPNFQIYSKPIFIGANSWVAAEAFVGPGVNVGCGAVLSARSVAFADLCEWTVYRGNPATPLKARTRFDR